MKNSANSLHTAAWSILLLCLTWTSHLFAADPITPDLLYDTNQLLEIEIRISTQNWNTMRMEHHDIVKYMTADRLKNPDPDVYHYVKADIAINGQWFRSVGIRKKGFLGSSSFSRPSMKVKFNEFVKGQKIPGISRLTLNNNNQDPTQLNQYLAYRLFREAGIPAPRCNLAHVIVNGESLGIYSHVESIRKDFLKEHYEKSNGKLYEGVAGADFTDLQLPFFQQKNKKTANNKTDLQKVARALEFEDDALLDQIEPLIDLGAFYRFWALETLTGHWDGYTDNQNNYYLYAVPTSGKFQFIPWGADSAFGALNLFRKVKMPESVKATAILPKRLYQITASRNQYRKVLGELLEEVWDEAELQKEIVRMQSLIEPVLHVDRFIYDESIAKMQHYIESRRALIMEELKVPTFPSKYPEGKRTFMIKDGSVTLDFKTVWADQPEPNPFKYKPKNWQLDLEGKSFQFIQQGVRAIPQAREVRFGQPTIQALGIVPNSSKLMILSLIIDPEFYIESKNIPVDGYAVSGWLVETFLSNPSSINIIGMLNGTIQLDEAGHRQGAPVSGNVKCDIYRIRR